MTRATLRRLGAIAILAVGAVHLQQYFSGYRSIPTIGPLFLLNALGSGIVAIGLLAPMQRIRDPRAAELTTGVLAAAGLAIAAGSLGALFISETGTLFGFSETGYRTVIVLAIIAEALTILLLAPVAAVSLRRAASSARAPRTTRAVSSR
jgi:multisubunit Na+/H+ antiporter MnhG subunit